MKSISIGIDGVGPVLFERSVKAIRINIYVRPLKGIRVAVPRGISFRQAENFVYSKLNWIQKSVAKIQKLEQKYEAVSENSRAIDRSKAKKTIINRLNVLAKRYGFTYNKVSIKNQRTRWGSCSGRNNINLNMTLVQLPEELMDYVILHELVHTRIKNHSPEFWDELDKHVGNAKLLSNLLKEYRPALL